MAVWKHSSLTRLRKLDVFRSLVEAKLVYALGTGCYTKAELRRLDGFQARCLRNILRIAPAYWSRVSNEAVRQRAGWKPISELIFSRQLVMLGKILQSGHGCPLRKVSFVGDTLRPATDQYVRRVGRPRAEWVPRVLEEARRRNVLENCDI